MDLLKINISKNITINGGFANGSNAISKINAVSLNVTSNLTIINIHFYYNSEYFYIYGENAVLTCINCSFVSYGLSLKSISFNHGSINLINSSTENNQLFNCNVSIVNSILKYSQFNYCNVGVFNSSIDNNNFNYSDVRIVDYSSLTYENRFSYCNVSIVNHMEHVLSWSYSFKCNFCNVSIVNYNCDFVVTFESIETYYCNVSIINCSFNVVDAVYGMFRSNNDYLFTMTNCSFANINRRYSEGVINNFGSKMVIINSYFEHNGDYSNLYSPVIYSNGNLSIVNCAFVNHTMYSFNIWAIGGILNVIDSYFANISSVMGDSIFIENTEALVRNCSFVGSNTIPLCPIFARDSNLSLDSNNFYNCAFPIVLNNNSVVLTQTYIVGDDVIGKVGDILPVNITFTDDNFNLIIFLKANDNLVGEVNGLVNDTSCGLILDNYNYVGIYSSDVAVVSNVSCPLVYFTNLTTLVDVIITNPISVVVDSVVMYWGNGSQLRVHVFDYLNRSLAGYNFTITVNGVSYSKTTGDDGFAYLALGGLRPNIYNVSVVSNEINNTMMEWNALVTVLHTINIGNFINNQYKNGILSAVILDGKGAPIGGINTLINIHGRLSYGVSETINPGESNSLGKIEFKVDLPPGDYIVTVYDLVTGHNRSSILTIPPENAQNNGICNLKLVDSTGNAVGSGVTAVLSINGFSYEKITNDEGVISFDINNPDGVKMETALSKPFNIVVLDENKVLMTDIHMNINSKEEITDKNGFASSDIELVQKIAIV